VTSRFTITATGVGGLTATQVFTLQTVDLGKAPKFTSANQVGFTVGVPNSFTVAAGPFVETITASGFGAGFTDNHDGTATLHFTPSAGTARQTITFTASNSNLNTTFHPNPYTATQTFTLVILLP
jgi:hypothetical protein